MTKAFQDSKIQSTEVRKMRIYVNAQTGNDKNPATAEAPLKTIERARDLAKENACDMQEDIVIYLKGKFRLRDTFKLDYTHSGCNGYNIVYTSWDKEKAVITMADEYTGFTLRKNFGLFKEP